ncbi:MAG: DUF2238 domain-containing protein [Phycisphaerae bacterium]|nr:DUF2238 domain-containing protein [Phycisphaerae bacterium]
MTRLQRDLLVGLVAVILVASGIHPYDRLTWVLEIFWVAGAIAIYPWFRTRRQPTDLLLVLLAIHAVILIVGGFYTYEHVPLGEWMKNWFGFSRNHYDRIGHFMQGFVPAILAREILIRNAVVRSRGWLVGCVFAFCLSFSAAFELFEWTAAMVFGDGSTAYLATQGDPWDAQKDMLMAAIGCVTALVLFSRLHDRQIATQRSA